MTTNDIRDALASALIQSRNDKGKTQKEMAALLGIRIQTIQNWECKKTNPDFINVFRWFDTLHVPAFKYFCINKNDALVEAVLSLSPRSQDQLLQLLSKNNREDIINYIIKGSEVFGDEN